MLLLLFLEEYFATHLASLENLCAAGGPTKNAASAVSANPSEGFCIRLQSSWAVFTRTCTQYVQMPPIIKVAIKPKNRPAFLKAIGMANIPLPKDPFSKWIRVSKSLKNKNPMIKLWLSCL